MVFPPSRVSNYNIEICNMDRVAGKLKPLEDVHFWPIANLSAAWERPHFSSAYHPEAVIGMGGELRAASDPKQSLGC